MSVIEQARSIFGRISRPHAARSSSRSIRKECKSLVGQLSQVDAGPDSQNTPVVQGKFSKYYLEMIANLEAQVK